MPLAPGTALQNGHYVIDALLEAAPNGDLYWGTHVVAGMPVFIQIFPVAGNSGQGDLSSLIARLEGVAFSPRSPLPNPLQLFRGDDHTLCLAMGTTVGLPWSSARKHYSPLSPKQALATIRQVASSANWLREQGLKGMDLSPNRVWLTPDLKHLTLTGLPHAYLQSDEAAVAPDTSVRALAKLLFSLLTGALLTTQDEMGDALRARLQQHRPNLSPVIIDAIEQGVRSPAAEPPLTLEQWLALLPNAGATHQLQSSHQPLTSRPAPVDTPRHASVSQHPQPPSKPKLLPALTGTALLAAIAGVGLGTVWRLNAKSLPGGIQLDPQQSFPAQAGWSGDTPTATFDTPYVPARNVPIRQDEWYDISPAETFEEPVYAPEAADPIDESYDESYLETDPTPEASPPIEYEESAPEIPVETPDEPAPAPEGAPSTPLEVPDEAPAETNPANFSNAHDALMQPLADPRPKATPTVDRASER